MGLSTCKREHAPGPWSPFLCAWFGSPRRPWRIAWVCPWVRHAMVGQQHSHLPLVVWSFVGCLVFRWLPGVPLVVLCSVGCLELRWLPGVL